MHGVEIAPGVHWVGAVDWDRRTFHGAHHGTRVGTTYNAYLVVDEKIALVDTVYKAFTNEMLARISELIDPGSIDYVIANHGEPDHSSALPEVLKVAKDAKLVSTSKGRISLQTQYHSDWQIRDVKTGDQIPLGEKTLSFLEAPMLHWPDSMFTYIPELQLLLSNDAFGQHLASSGRFDDEVDESVLMEEARSYYANILTPFSSLVLKKIDEVVKAGIEISTIAPSHGIVWRRDPGKIIQAYARWASGEAAGTNAIVAYESMWGGTEAMARMIVEGLTSKGIKTRMFKLSGTPRSQVIAELLEARGIVVGSATLNNGVLPQVAELLSELKGLRFKGRLGAAFGCFGWSGGGTKVVNQALEEAGIKTALPSMDVNWHPDREALQKCFEYGRQFADAITK